MVSNLINILRTCPNWSPHRAGIVAAGVETSFPITSGVSTSGVPTDGYDLVLVRFRTTGSPTGVTLRPLFWDEVGSLWVPDADIAATAFTTTAGQFSFNSYGRRFYIALTALAGGTNPTVDMEVAGYGL